MQLTSTKVLRFLAKIGIRASQRALGDKFITMNFHLFSQLISANTVLEFLGATVGKDTRIAADICIYNLPNRRCCNLKIGSNVYIGPRCLFDLNNAITIEDDAAISAEVAFITHIDVGNQPLKEIVPYSTGPITVKRGAWVGTNSTILLGVTIGEYCRVGAMSLVNRDLPSNSLSFGIPCKPRPSTKSYRPVEAKAVLEASRRSRS